MAKYEYKQRWFYSRLETYVEEKKGLLSSSSTEKTNPRLPNIGVMAADLVEAISMLENDGYEIHTILPIQVGSVEPSIGTNAGYLGDAGFSLTRGAIVVGRRLADGGDD